MVVVGGVLAAGTGSEDCLFLNLFVPKAVMDVVLKRQEAAMRKNGGGGGSVTTATKRRVGWGEAVRRPGEWTDRAPGLGGCRQEG